MIIALPRNLSNKIVTLCCWLNVYVGYSMKMLTLSALIAQASSLICTSVYAVDGTIKISGSIVDETCTLELGTLGKNGARDLSVRLKTLLPSQIYTSTGITFFLTDTAGSPVCDVATKKAFKGVHLSPNVAVDLDAMDKTLLVNKSLDASATSPVFLKVLTDQNNKVDFSAPWATQAKSTVKSNFDAATLYYTMQYFSKKGAVDTQKLTTLVNYTLHYN